MKKAELRGMPVLKVTEKIRKMVAEDKYKKVHTGYHGTAAMRPISIIVIINTLN